MIEIIGSSKHTAQICERAKKSPSGENGKLEGSITDPQPFSPVRSDPVPPLSAPHDETLNLIARPVSERAQMTSFIAIAQENFKFIQTQSVRI